MADRKQPRAKAVNVTKLSSNEVDVAAGTKSIVGHTCGRRYIWRR